MLVFIMQGRRSWGGWGATAPPPPNIQMFCIATIYTSPIQPPPNNYAPHTPLSSCDKLYPPRDRRRKGVRYASGSSDYVQYSKAKPTPPVKPVNYSKKTEHSIKINGDDQTPIVNGEDRSIVSADTLDEQLYENTSFVGELANRVVSCYCKFDPLRGHESFFHDPV